MRLISVGPLQGMSVVLRCCRFSRSRTCSSPNLNGEQVSKITKPEEFERHTLLLRKVNGVLLRLEGQAGALHVIRAIRGVGARYQTQKHRTYELAHPMRGFSQRPPPGRMSQSIRQRLDLPGPLWVVLRVGWKILTARWRSSSALVAINMPAL